MTIAGSYQLDVELPDLCLFNGKQSVGHLVDAGSQPYSILRSPEIPNTEVSPQILSVQFVSRSEQPLAPPRNIDLRRMAGRPVVRSLKELHLHPASKSLGWAGLVEEFNDAARAGIHSIHDPVFIATDGTILAGFGSWRLAVLEGTADVPCIEYHLNEDESLQFIITHHQTRRGWNDFVRISLALSRKSSLQQAGLNNMRFGGKYKGLANLPEAHRLDVRQQIAAMAGVCPRSVGNVERILEIAHPALIEALRNGTLKINRAMQFCKSPRDEQLEAFIRYSEERAISKIIRGCLVQQPKNDSSLDPGTVLEALHSREESSRSVAVRIVRNKGTVILVGQDLLAEINSQKELPLK